MNGELHASGRTAGGNENLPGLRRTDVRLAPGNHSGTAAAKAGAHLPGERPALILAPVGIGHNRGNPRMDRREKGGGKCDGIPLGDAHPPLSQLRLRGPVTEIPLNPRTEAASGRTHNPVPVKLG